MYEELVKRLKNCTSDTVEDCARCPYQGGYKGTYCMNGLIAEAADAIEELSNGRKTGEWCADYDGYSDGEPVYDMWWCSACGEYFDEWDDRPTWKYCPNCGAKMSEGDEDEEPPKEET